MISNEYTVPRFKTVYCPPIQNCNQLRKRVLILASLQDQLLKAGLADPNKAKTIHKEKRKQTKVARKSNQPVENKQQQAANQKKQKQAQRDRELNKQKQALIQEKSIAAQISQLIETNKIDRENGEISFSFIHDKKIKSVYVTEEIQTQLSRGNLSMVSQKTKKAIKYEIVPCIVAKKISERDPNCIIETDQNEKEESHADDPYAAFVIPDDLTW